MLTLSYDVYHTFTHGEISEDGLGFHEPLNTDFSLPIRPGYVQVLLLLKKIIIR